MVGGPQQNKPYLQLESLTSTWLHHVFFLVGLSSKYQWFFSNPTCCDEQFSSLHSQKCSISLKIPNHSMTWLFIIAKHSSCLYRKFDNWYGLYHHDKLRMAGQLLHPYYLDVQYCLHLVTKETTLNIQPAFRQCNLTLMCWSMPSIQGWQQWNRRYVLAEFDAYLWHLSLKAQWFLCKRAVT